LGLRERFEENAARVAESAQKAAASATAQRVGEGFDGLRSLFDDDGEALSAERFLLALVRAVRTDDHPEERRARDVYVTARKRRRRLGLISFGTGPLVGVANQLTDLYCETATVCDVAAFHGLNLSGEEIGAHMVVLWGIADTYPTARKAINGEPPVARLLAADLGERLGERLPERLTKRSLTKALWDARAAVGDARKSATSGAVRSVMFTGHRTKKVIGKAEEQLGVSR
jgi:hypothetical protein